MDSRTLQAITLATTGRMQAAANDGGLANIEESDLRAALRDSAYPHADHVSVEARVTLADWPGVGACDVQIGDGPRRMLVECKWCTDKHKLAETLWDLLKLASVVQSGKAATGFIAACAPASTWEHAPAAVLFAERDWGCTSFSRTLPTNGRGCFAASPRPARNVCQRFLEVARVSKATISCSGAEPWVLGSFTVTASGSVMLDADGVVLIEEVDPPGRA